MYRFFKILFPIIFEFFTKKNYIKQDIETPFI